MDNGTLSFRRRGFAIKHAVLDPSHVDTFRGKVVDLPEVNLDELDPEDRELFSDYRPGRMIFKTASDVYDFEKKFGSRELIAMFDAEYEEAKRTGCFDDDPSLCGDFST